MTTFKRILVLVPLLLVLLPASARAETSAPGWEATVRSLPTHLRPGGQGDIHIDVYNTGGISSTGVATVTDVLPPQLTFIRSENGLGIGGDECSAATVNGATVVTCIVDPFHITGFFYQPVGFHVSVASDASGTVTNHVTVSGGGAATVAQASDQLDFSSVPPPFGFANFDGWISNADGTPDTQAGSHPYEFTATFDLNTAATAEEESHEHFSVAGGEMRNITVQTPPGIVGDPNAVPQCTRAQFDDEKCPAATQIGFDTFELGSEEGTYFETEFFRRPVFNMVPPPGLPAQFAFTIEANQVFLDAGVRSGGDYGITEHADNLSQREIGFNTITLWGVPAAPIHDSERGQCGERGEGECPSGAPEVPLLTLPTSCTGPLSFAIEADTWENSSTGHAEFTSHASDGTPIGLTGCDRLGFGQSITVAPDTSFADTPAGLTVELKVPQEGLVSPEGLATSNIKDTTVKLPEGLVINPGQAAGLQACGAAEDGLTTEAERAKGEEDSGPASCPNASKVGIVTIRTPLLESAAEKQFEGNVYVLQSNPPELKLLFAASADGVNVKLVNVVHLNERTGQLEAKFENTPELPFTDFKLSFSGGAQAALDTPTQCGAYGPAQGFSADFTPWASPFVADAFPTAAFAVEHGTDGAPCPSSPLPFSPTLTAGATTDQAGGYTDFSLLLQRGDSQQRIDGLQFKAPNGLTGFLSHVPLCTNAQAESNTCPEASKIGHTVVESGPGPYPLVVPEPGQEPAPIYLTESYDGAPFGLSVVVPLHVGPFVLPTQRVRAKIEVNPITSALTVTTNPFPQEIAGVPTDLREVDAVIERPEFMVNPTNCSPSEFSGTAYGTAAPGQNEPGSEAHISSHFQVGACRSLEFAPKFSVSTSGKTSKSQGASLTAKVSYPNVPQGTQADIGYVKVELPEQLPSRLTTLQKACTDKQFEANPAGCPPASFIGHAVVHTPLLPVPLEGPAIFVSHGGEAFPSLTMVLQGDGVTVDLVGATFISKAGVTSTTFHTVPDDPFSTFELTLPEGPYSALAANGNLCQSKLVMPNEFIGQNGAAIHQDTAISVEGCSPAIYVVSHKVRDRTATIQVRVPAAGKLVATAKGFSKASKTDKGATTLTLKLTLTNAEAAFLGKHKTRKLKAKVNLQFTPKTGAKLKTSTTVIVG
jgi:uncharacterized repeat protein (TIGR01451 family)